MSRNRPVPFLISALVAVVAALVTASPAVAQNVPPLMHQEGLVLDRGGAALAGPVDLRFELFPVALNGQAGWTENHAQVALVEGYYSVLLGNQQALTPALVLTNPYLQISVNGQRLDTRVRLVSVPFALVAQSVKGGAADVTSVAIGGNLVIDPQGRWVGNAAGLQGPAGPVGPQGPAGPVGPAGGNGSPDTPEQVRAKLVQVDGAGSAIDADRLDGFDSSDLVRTAEQVLERLRTVDGANSGVDADRLDGLDSADFVRTAAQVLERLRTVDGEGSGVDADRLDGLDSGEFVRTGEQILEKLRPVDGAGSGLDADRLDGLDSTQFLRSDANGILAGNLDVRGLLRIMRSNGPPVGCDAAHTGEVYFNTTDAVFFGCDGTEWVRMSGDAGAGPGGGGDPNLGGDIRNPGADCLDILERRAGAQNGVYWIDPDGNGGDQPFKVLCDLAGGGWAMIYATYVNQAGAGAWAMPWNDVVATGRRFDDPADGRNYLMPIRYWVNLDAVRLNSQRSGQIVLDDFSISPNNNYRWSFRPTGHNGMDYHNNRPLSTVDRDNDIWGNSCAGYGQTFGWYGECCSLCMTTGQGGWPGGTPQYVPSDWTYRQTDWMVWWGRFRRIDRPRNDRAAALADCEAVRAADARSPDGLYWIDPDGAGGEDSFVARCDISGGGWTQIYGTYQVHGSPDEWALRWDDVINQGKNHNSPQPNQNYLLPIKFWPRLGTVDLRSATSGSLRLENFRIAADQNYRMSFTPTNHNGMNYHNGRFLSTVDRDNDIWANSCANYGRTFGWYGECCSLCMTTGEGGWPGGTPRYMPSDWTYRLTPSMTWWGKFRQDPQPLNNREQAAADCQAIKQAAAASRTGIYWVTLGSPERFKVWCDMDRDGGGWTLVYSFWNHETGINEWALSYDTVVTLGKRHDSPTAENNYLLPLRYWNRFRTLKLSSQVSGDLLLTNFSFNVNDNYRFNFDQSANNGINYHRGRPLSAVDRDNDIWGNSCAGYGRTFGWYGECCSLCMTTGQGGWPGGSTPYFPSDWNYRQTTWMLWWGR